MVTGTQQYREFMDHRNAVKFGVETIRATEKLDGKVTEFNAWDELMGFRVPYVQRFHEIVIFFTYEGQGYHYISAPILRVEEEKGVLTSFKRAVIDDDAMEEEFQKQLEELKESIKNDPEFNTDGEQPH